MRNKDMDKDKDGEGQEQGQEQAMICSTWAEQSDAVGREETVEATATLTPSTASPILIQGGFFDWSTLKMTKCQTLRKF